LPEEAFYQGYQLEGKSALRHLLRVGSSLESLVIGETQILGQLKDSLKAAQHSSLPPHSSLERAFQLCFQIAKRVRTETQIAEKPVSVATLGLHHLQRLEADFPLKRAVVVGRGPISQLTVQWLLKNRPHCPIVWVNRSLGSLGGIMESAQTECVALSDFLSAPPEFSHLFTSTASTEPLFTSEFFSRLEEGPRLLFDFAQPPDVDPQADLRGGKLLHLEHFDAEARENAHAREQGVEKAESIIDQGLKSFCLEQKETPLLKEFSAAEQRIFEDLADALLRIQNEFPEAIQPKVRKWAEKLVKKNWHLSREHLREILQRATEPDRQVPLV
jgi:glutamyl-tRNA reductase